MNGRVIDLFAGAGGFSLGAEMAGLHVSHAVEIDAWACQTLERNHTSTSVHCMDLQAASDDWIKRTLGPGPEVLIGGPPCQGFSHAGPAKKDPKDPRNSLFREFVRVARLLEPEIVLLENVTGMLRAKTATGEPVPDIIEQELQALGYRTSRMVLDAHHYGVPQIRRRVFFLGVSSGTPATGIPPTHGDGPAELFAPALLPFLTVRDAISDLPRVDVGHRDPVVAYDRDPENPFQELMRAGSSEVHNHLPMRHSPRSVQRFALIAPGQSQSHVTDASLAPRRRVRAEGDGPGTYDQNNRRMHWDRPCHTLAASFYANFLHPELHRNFTPREGARIQTFPDRYVFEGKPTVVSAKLLTREGRTAEKHLCQYNQIGNAVPPLLGKVVIEAAMASRLAVGEERDVA